MISASQIRAARALLDWSQDDLADAAQLSRTTVRTVELGYAARAGNIHEIRKALEMNGIEFLDGDGVRRQPEGKRDFTGANSCDRFFDSVLQSVKQDRSELICFIESQNMLTKISGSTRRTNLERLEDVHRATGVKCFISDTIAPTFALPNFEIRIIREDSSVFPMSCFAFSNQLVLAYLDSNLHFSFAVFQKASFVQRCQNYFLPRWDSAKPLQLPQKSKKLCA